MIQHKLLNEKNWFLKNHTPESIIYKKSTMEALNLIKSNFGNYDIEKFRYIFKDIDVLSYAFSNLLFQNSPILSHRDVISHIKNIDKSRFILKNGCISKVASFIFKQQPALLKEEDLTFLMLKQFNRDDEIVSLYEETLKNPEFIKKLLRKKIVFPKLLKFYPKHLKLSRLLVEQGSIPYYNKSYEYHEGIYKDIEFVKTILAGRAGERFYDTLPKQLKDDLAICQHVLNYHPIANVNNNGLNNIDDFKNFVNGASTFCSELYTVLDKAQKTSIFNTIENVIELFSLINEKNMTCYVDLMGGPQFKNHPVQKYLNKLSTTNIVLKQFLNSDAGQAIINYPIETYSQFENFELNVLPTIKHSLEIFYHYYQLNQTVAIKNDVQKKVKQKL